MLILIHLGDQNRKVRLKMENTLFHSNDIHGDSTLFLIQIVTFENNH